ncbi:hypothetical protein BG000_011575 [Podila horticola]|nr:hypothetical protein BG000_011575 [Podila horticola]
MKDAPLSPLSPQDENQVVDRVTKNHAEKDSVEEASYTPRARGPISIKRRKMSEDEECHASEISGPASLPSDYPSPPFLQHLHHQHQQPSSVTTPPQKRRKNLAPIPLAKDRKRRFEDAIEMMRPLGSSEITAELSGWFESVKRRKIHHYPTRWTSSLAPSPYVKLMAMRDFWDMMMGRVDLSWLNFWKISAIPSRLQGFGKAEEEEEEDAFCYEEEYNEDMDRQQSKDQSFQRRPMTRKKSVKILVQYPNPGLFLKGLWEEEEKHRRKQQMIPDNVHKPMRSKILNGKPISRMNLTKSGSWMKSKASRSMFSGCNSTSSSLSSSLSSSSSSPTCSSSSGSTSKDETEGDTERNVSDEETPQEKTTQKGVDCEDVKKKASRSHALSESCDLTEYKPWKDGTVTPSRGSIKTLCEMRNTMLDPWPSEESKAKDECTRILHRMREQLNVVINLQIHLRTMMKTAPTHMSFLLSIRHPGQVSIELLRALYGPQFMQTSAFRTIEQLLWGKHPSSSLSCQNSESSYQGSSHRHYRQQTHHGHHHHFQQQARPEEDEDAECEFEERFDDAYQDPIVDLDHNVVVDSRMEDEEEEMEDGHVGRHHGEECVALSVRS